MKTMERNKVPFWYLLYDHKEEVVDEYGNDTGESKIIYASAQRGFMNVSAATGSAQVEQFGAFTDYSRVIVTDDMSCPMDENSVLFLEKEPEYAEDGTPLYDYIVKRVAKSLNSISYAVRKVSVS